MSDSSRVYSARAKGLEIGEPEAIEEGAPKITKAELIQLILENSTETRVKTLTFRGYQFNIRYRKLSWQEQKRCATTATALVQEINPITGQNEAVARFRKDIYDRLALKEMIVESVVPFTDSLIENLDPELGVQLEEIIPDPFMTISNIDVIKKESEA